MIPITLLFSLPMTVSSTTWQSADLCSNSTMRRITRSTGKRRSKRWSRGFSLDCPSTSLSCSTIACHSVTDPKPPEQSETSWPRASCLEINSHSFAAYPPTQSYPSRMRHSKLEWTASLPSPYSKSKSKSYSSRPNSSSERVSHTSAKLNYQKTTQLKLPAPLTNQYLLSILFFLNYLQVIFS